MKNKNLIELLKHAKRDAKHNFVKEALNSVFNAKVNNNVKKIIKNNMNYRQKNGHRITILKNKKGNYMACDTKTQKIYKPSKINVIKALNNIIKTLRKNNVEKQEDNINNQNLDQSKQIRVDTYKTLKKASKYDDEFYHYQKEFGNNHHAWVLCNLAQNNLATVLHLVQACDYPIAFVNKSLSNPKQYELFTLWTQFLGRNTTQLHTALLANIHLSNTDKLIGAVIDTYVGFLYVTIKSKSAIMTVNLNIIALTLRMSLQQVKKSVRKLGQYAHYFDNSQHLEDNL